MNSAPVRVGVRITGWKGRDVIRGARTDRDHCVTVNESKCHKDEKLAMVPGPNNFTNGHT